MLTRRTARKEQTGAQTGPRRFGSVCSIDGEREGGGPNSQASIWKLQLRSSRKQKQCPSMLLRTGGERRANSGSCSAGRPDRQKDGRAFSEPSRASQPASQPASTAHTSRANRPRCEPTRPSRREDPALRLLGWWPGSAASRRPASGQPAACQPPLSSRLSSRWRAGRGRGREGGGGFLGKTSRGCGIVGGRGEVRIRIPGTLMQPRGP